MDFDVATYKTSFVVKRKKKVVESPKNKVGLTRSKSLMFSVSVSAA